MTTLLKETAHKIELHYFFSDETHSMNALIRNKCESNLLAILKEISSVLNARLQVETEAYQEGGLKERLLLKAKSDFLMTFAAQIFSDVMPLEVDLEKTVNEENKQETKERVESLRRELKQFEKDAKAGLDLENVNDLFQKNLKIIKLKSNFYKQLSACEKVTKVSVQLMDADNGELRRAVSIHSKSFKNFILKADALKPEVDETAIIEIISPVLKTGSYKWKGIYALTGKIISFSMKDNDFKNEVISQGLAFKNGTRIECSLESTRKMNEFGEVVVTGYSVLSVNQKLDGEATSETPRVRTKPKKKEPEMQQLDLFAGFS